MDNKNLYLIGGFALILLSGILENPYIKLFLASVGVILLIIPIFKRRK
jgi:hypothetical protein